MKRLARVSAILTIMAVLLTGCNCYNKMKKNVDQIRATSNPELLTLKGSTVTADITVTFPAKYFHKKAVFKITPVLSFDSGSLAGVPKYLQGEKVKDNYTVIPYARGGSYSQTVVIPYENAASLSTLELRIDAKCGKGTEFLHIAVITVAEGVSAVQNSADWFSNLSIMPDNFKRITTITQEADLMYLINSSQVRQSALTTDQIRLFEEFVKENSDKDRTTLGNVYAKGYASPDGPVALNDQLSRRRSETAQAAVQKELSGISASYDAAAYGEDWDGFRKLVEASDIPDRNLILQVLSIYNSPVERDQQIKNMSQVFEVLKRDIFPQLRRTQLVASADISGKTDAEIRAAFNGNANSLNLEETLYAATLFSDNATKARAYRSAADRFNDARAYNNYGVIMALDGDLADAKQAFNRAASISSAPEISNNLGALALAEGNLAEARRYLSPLNTADARSNKALLALAEGDYATAARDLTGYNLAVADFCNGNVSKAKAGLANISTADADYLKAVIAMREGDTQGAVANLRSAIGKDSSLRAKAQKDIEFSKIFGVREFITL